MWNILDQSPSFVVAMQSRCNTVLAISVLTISQALSKLADVAGNAFFPTIEPSKSNSDVIDGYR